jgi:hypothetical protein
MVKSKMKYDRVCPRRFEWFITSADTRGSCGTKKESGQVRMNTDEGYFRTEKIGNEMPGEV